MNRLVRPSGHLGIYSMVLELLKIILIRIFLPAGFLYMFAIGNVTSTIEWLLLAAGIGAFITYNYITGEWFFFGYYFRYVFPAAFVVTVIVTMRSMIELPFYINFGLKA